MASDPQHGTITFLFTDIQGSTGLAQADPAAWDALQEHHHAILRAAMEDHNGDVFLIVGDAFCVAFRTAQDGLQAALDAQRRLHAEALTGTPIKVRMGLHTGPARKDEDQYRGYLTLARVQRVMAAAYGQQILISNACAAAVGSSLGEGITLRDMKEHRLKGFGDLERLWQVDAPDLPNDFPPLPTLKVNANNLPFQATTFIGREKEISELTQLLSRTRLLTLTGSGGTGKTRLALQVAEQAQDSFGDGVWLIELAPLSEAALVLGSIAAELGIREEPGRPLLAAVTDWLRDKELLLILDNCEHLVLACAQLAAAVLKSTRGIRLLATSREVIGIAGETTYRVPSLPIPDQQQKINLTQLEQVASVRLFVDRAGKARPSFRITRENASAVAQICSRLDGIPLAIELAAARIRALSADQIATRLDDSFRMLAGGNRTALPRHQTLWAMIDWSYNLLTDAEQTLFCRLAVFAGGWTLESAEAVCGGRLNDLDVLNLLVHLVDKSLVVLEEDEGTARYHLLETTRQYARQRLAEKKEEEEICNQHLHHFLGFAETGEKALRGAVQLDWLDLLQAELNNFRAALEWSGRSGRAEEGLRLATALWWFWNLRSLIGEGYELLRKNLVAGREAQINPAIRARALYRLGHLAHYLGEPVEHRRQLWQESLDLNRRLGRFEDCTHTLIMLSWIADDVPAAENLCQEALGCARKSDSPWMVPATLLNMADLMVDTARHEQAVVLLNECIFQFRSLGDRWGIAWSLLLLAKAQNLGGHTAEVPELLAEAETLFHELKFLVGVRLVAATQGNIELESGHYQQASLLFEKNLALAREMGLRNAIAEGLLSLAASVYHQGEYPRAAALMSDALAAFRDQGTMKQIPAALAGLAQALAALGIAERAAGLLGAAQEQGRLLDRAFSAREHADHDRTLETLRGLLGASACEEIMTQGRKMSLSQAIAYVLEEKP